MLSLPVVLAKAQIRFEKIAVATTKENIVSASVDRAGDFYFITTPGIIMKYDANGQSLASTSLSVVPDLFDPRDGSHLFAYFRPRKYEIRLPDLQLAKSGTVDSSMAISPYLVSPSGDHDFLVLDSADWSLKKVNAKDGTIAYETIVFDGSRAPREILFMREYQNFIFILQENSILIYNRMGKFLKRLSCTAKHFNFLGEELYFLDGDNLRLIDLFTSEERTMTLPDKAVFALLTDERLVLVTGKTAVFYSVQQQ